MNNTNETDGKNELITYHVYLRDSGKEIANLSVQINPKDTLKSFVDKLMQTWFVQYLDKSDVKSDGKFCAVRLLYNTTIINPLDTEMTVGGYFSNQSDISINSVISLETNRSSSGSGGRIFLEDVMNSDAVKSAEAGTEDLGKLPLYKVVSKEDAANPGKKCNRFEKTGEFIGLSMKGKEFGYKGFDVSIDKECVLKATNPLHRFIISDHLRTQQKTGRLTGAKNISKRKIGGFDNMPTKEAEKNNTKVSEVSNQNGWQGINVADYTKVYYNSNTGVSGNDYKDALDYYAKMSDILLDKAWLSEDKNLDILILAAGKLFDNKKIDLEQFSNVILMLRYAYELRKLPNEKDGELKSEVDPIQLSEEAYGVIDKVLTNAENELNELLRNEIFQDINKEFGDIKSQDPASENGNNEQIIKEDRTEKNTGNEIFQDIDKEFGDIKSQDLAFENGNNGPIIEENRREKNTEFGSVGPEDSTSENKGVILKKATDLVVKSIELQKQLKQGLAEKQLQYKEKLLDYVKNKKEKCKKGQIFKTKKLFENSVEESEVSFEAKNLDEFANKIESVYKEECKGEKNDFNTFLSKTKGNDKDNSIYVIEQFYGDHYFFIEDFLSQKEKDDLLKIESEIKQTFERLKKHKKMIESKPFEKIVKSCEICKYAAYCIDKIKVSEPGKLSRWQLVLNWILSLGHLLNYQYYKIDSGINLRFDNNDAIFNKYNAKKEEKTISEIPESILDEYGTGYFM